MDLKIEIRPSGPLFDGSAAAAFQDAADEFVEEVVALLESEVRALTPVGVFGAQGGLLGGIHGEVINHGTPLVYGVVGHQSIYGDVREAGRQPGRMPPAGSLIRWIEVVMGADPHTAKRIEYVVRRKIGQKGYKGAFMFDRAFRDNEARITGIAEEKGLVFRLGGES